MYKYISNREEISDRRVLYFRVYWIFQFNDGTSSSVLMIATRAALITFYRNDICSVRHLNSNNHC